jgi:putative Ca2+/H+ antiporter (TMEM165/GDT1 family)
VKVQSAPTKSDLSDEISILNKQAQTNRSQIVATLEKPETDAQLPKITLQKQTKKHSGQIFGSTFLTIFLAEFGDKTQLSTLLMSAESQSPWVVFLGAGTALISTSLLGVILGQWLAKRFAPKTLEKAAGASLLVISAMLFWDVMQF